ncbi:MAG: hypothetical protein KGI45_02525 [Patescibacteria group bacterium]|nr:hypothetical protein [Patescibacteria group bacterium]MDE1966927.1 hypothetical protein [Patescibacteria group bacterium]
MKRFIKDNRRLAIGAAAGAVILSALGIGALAARGSRGADTVDRPPAIAGAPSRLGESGIPEYDFTEAPDHIGEKAAVSGVVLKAFTSQSGVTFLDFCKTSKCPFSAVIFKDNAAAFGDMQSYVRPVTLTGVIRSYEGSAEMILDDPGQIE